MKLRSIALSALLIIGGMMIPLGAQQAAAPAPNSEPGRSDIDVSKLPLNLTRLQTKLQASVERQEQPDASRIRFTIDVLGIAPRFKLFTPEDNLLYGPVPFGAPTHRDMMNLATPKEFSAPVMDFNSLMKWIQSKTAKN